MKPHMRWVAYFLALGTVISLTFSCAGAKVRPSPETANIISGMEIKESNTATTILLKGSKPTTFNPFKMTDPLRVVVDIANSDVTNLKSSTSVNNGFITKVKASQMGEETGFIGRIEIGLEKSLKYTVNSEGNDLKIEISKTEALPEPSPIEGEVAVPPSEVAEVAGLPVSEETVPPPVEEGAVAEAPPPEGEALPPMEAAPPLAGEELPPTTEAPPPVAEAPPPTEEVPLVEEAPPPAPAPPPVAEVSPEVAPPAEAPMVEEKAPPPVVAVVPPPPPIEVPSGKIRVEKGKIRLPKPIVFGSSVAQTTPEGEAILKELAEFLKENPTLKVRIEGYTDTIGPREFNKAVSEYRAIWAKLLLMSMGIPDGRIQVRGFGPSHPIASNKTEAGRARNRRIEFAVLTR